MRYGKAHAETVIEIVRRASAIITDSVLRQDEIDEGKGKGNFVTKYDVAVQEFLIDTLSAAFPMARFFAEEKKDNLLTDAPTFIIDPIDGTTNFVFDLHHSAISVALCDKKETVIGVVCNPYSSEIFYAIKGEGAYLRKGELERRLSVKDAPLSDSLVLVGTDPYRKSITYPLTVSLMGLSLKMGMDVRRLGAASLDLAYLAAGRANLFFELSLSPWDYAAGALLVTEAGGCVSTLGLSALNYAQSSVLAGAPTAYGDFAKRLLPQVEGLEKIL